MQEALASRLMVSDDAVRRQYDGTRDEARDKENSRDDSKWLRRKITI